MTWEEAYGKEKTPSMEEISAFIGNPCWERLLNTIEAEYGSKPSLHYSGCSMQRGWNLKFRKSGRSLCTLYPTPGWYYALVVLNDLALEHARAMHESFSPAVQTLLAQAQQMKNQAWLMAEIHDQKDMEDALALLHLRKQYQ